MRCDEAMSYVDAYADCEVRGWRKLRVRRHLQACPGCAARLDQALALKARIRAEAPRYAAPARLRARAIELRDAAIAAGASRAQPNRRWTWVTGGALAGSAATIVVWLTAGMLLAQRVSNDVGLAAVDAHTRATLAGTLTQVASSDQHTVKPWLSARLDYSPPVRDYASDGYPLVGGRIERMRNRDVATLVYRYRDHTIDVYALPQPERFGIDLPRNIRGFNIVHTAGNGMDWLVVSDASIESLAPLVRELRGP